MYVVTRTLPTFDLETTEDAAIFDYRDLALQIDTFEASMQCHIVYERPGTIGEVTRHSPFSSSASKSRFRP
jgi:hypothetical protein